MSEQEVREDEHELEESATPEETESDEMESEDEVESTDDSDDSDEDFDFEAESDEDEDVEVEDYAHESSDEPSEDPEDGAQEPTLIDLAKHQRLQQLRLEAKVEAIIFASQKPQKIPEILETLGDDSVSEEDLKATLDQITAHYEAREGGFKLCYLKRLGYQFQTSQNAGPIMERMFASRPRPISRAALETLAIIAYRQPVTRAEVEFIRGVDAGSIFRTLMERDLVKCTGRKEVVGRPMLFGTTDEFLKVFNISSVKDLPPLEAFQPSPDTMSGAKEKLGMGDAPIDIEKYIADNTREVDEDEDEEVIAVQGATVAADDGEWDEESSDSEQTLVGASATDDADDARDISQDDPEQGLASPPAERASESET